MGVRPDPDFPRRFAETQGFLLGRPVRARATPDGRFVLFLRGEARSARHDLFELEVATGITRKVADAAQILGGGVEVLTDAERARRERQRITDSGFVAFDISPDGRLILLPLAGRLYLLERHGGRIQSLLPDAITGVLDARFSPDGLLVGFVHESNLFLACVAEPGRAPAPVTQGGHATRFFGLAEFVAQEEMARSSGYWFSPDGALVAFTEVDESGVETFAIADPARPGHPPVTFRYPRPGQANARVRLAIAATRASGVLPATRGPVWIRWDHERYPYLTRFFWPSTDAPPVVQVQTRDQREAVLLAIDTGTGETRAIHRETDPAWVNLENGLPRPLAGGGFLNVSEHGGQRVLSLHRNDGTPDRTLLGPGQEFLSLIGLEPGGQKAFVLCGDALTSRVARVSLTGASEPPAIEILLDDAADRSDRVVTVSASGTLLLETRTRADDWPVTRAVPLSASGQPGVPVPLPDVAEEPPFLPNLSYTRVTDRDLQALVIRPHDFSPARRYPVVVHVYGGPHSLMVRADARHYLMDQWIADHGVIVVAIDNRGTPRRDPVFERAIKNDLGSLALADQVDGLHALGQKFPELDLARVGIYGWSFGGTMSALAIMQRPDVFKVAVSGAPVCDWHDYDTHYTERYLDLPDVNPEGYRISNPISHAGKLERPLLLIHGTADDNVYFFHSLKLAEALLRAGRPFDFLPLPRTTHQLGDPDIRREVHRRLAEYLLAHL